MGSCCSMQRQDKLAEVEEDNALILPMTMERDKLIQDRRLTRAQSSRAVTHYDFARWDRQDTGARLVNGITLQRQPN